MDKNPNPIHNNGSRNLFCPYYGDCLDHAAKLHWEAWACFDCYHKMLTEAGAEGPFSSGDTTPYYRISPEIHLHAG
jgi:hypothetical protein